VGGRARLGLPDGRDRLPHARDRRLAPGGSLQAKEAIALIERAAPERAIAPGTLTLGTDNGSAFTARACKAVLAAMGIAHRRGGYRDPESQAFIKSWFGKLKQRCVWRHEFETLDQARETIDAHVIHYHHRPHSRSTTARRSKSRPPGTMEDQPTEVSVRPSLPHLRRIVDRLTVIRIVDRHRPLPAGVRRDRRLIDIWPI
jgi:hypothetical protein